MIRLLAWKPLCVVIIFVNSCERSTACDGTCTARLDINKSRVARTCCRLIKVIACIFKSHCIRECADTDLLDSKTIINIELQVRAQNFWNDRSLSYLCRLFDHLEKGEDYFDVRPAYHIGIVNFTPFPDYFEFHATNMMMNVQKHYIYNDKFMLNVLKLKQIELATDEDKQWKLDYWARLFQSKTWEELKMLAQQNDVFMETCETIFQKNQDEKVRYWCEAREEAERIARSVKRDYENQLAEKDSIIIEKDNTITDMGNTIVEKDNALTEKDNTIAEMRAQIAALMAQLNQK